MWCTNSEVLGLSEGPTSRASSSAQPTMARSGSWRSCDRREAVQIFVAAAQLELAAPQLQLQRLALGDVQGEEHQPADAAVGPVPGPRLPLHPHRRAVGGLELVFGARLHRAREHPAVGLFPSLGQVGEHVVVSAPDELRPRHLGGALPGLARVQVPQLEVEHGDGRGRVAHELSEHARVALPFALGEHLLGHVVEGAHQRRHVARDVAFHVAPRPRVPALTVGPHHLELKGVPLAGGEGPRDGGAEPFPTLGREALALHLGGGRDVCRRQPDDAKHLGRPFGMPAGDVEGPTADARHPLRPLERGVGVAQLGIDAGLRRVGEAQRVRREPERAQHPHQLAAGISRRPPRQLDTTRPRTGPLPLERHPQRLRAGVPRRREEHRVEPRALTEERPGRRVEPRLVWRFGG